MLVFIIGQLYQSILFCSILFLGRDKSPLIPQPAINCEVINNNSSIVIFMILSHSIFQAFYHSVCVMCRLNLIIFKFIMLLCINHISLAHNLEFDSKQQIILHPKPIRVPEVFFLDSKGTKIYLENFNNNIVLLNFWATWCTFCTNKMLSLDRLQKEFKNYPFKVLPISIDYKSLDVVENFYKKKNIVALQIYLDPKASAMRELNIKNIPASILINEHGKEIMRIHGVVDWDNDKQIRKIITDKLNHIQNVEVEEEK